MTTVIKFCSSWASWMRLSVFLTEYPIWVSLLVWEITGCIVEDQSCERYATLRRAFASLWICSRPHHISSFPFDARLPFCFRIFFWLELIRHILQIHAKRVSFGWNLAGIIVEERILSRGIHYIGSSAISRISVGLSYFYKPFFK
jgi:hypothetical protein